MSHPRLLSPTEVAEYLGIGKSTAYSLGIFDRIPSIRIGGREKFDRNDVDLWIDKLKQQQETRKCKSA